MKAHRSVARYATRSLESSKLGLSDFAVLEVLLNRGPQKVSEIGRRVNLTSGSITTAIDRLEKRGFVARALDGADRRTRIVRLTKRGKTYIDGVFIEHQASLEAAARGLTKAELSTLTGLLKKLGTSADANF